MARDILIYRDFPIVNGYVQVSPNLEKEKTSIAAGTAITVVETIMSSELDVEQSIGKQKWIRLPGIDPSGWHTNVSGENIDPAALLRQL